MKTVRKTPNCLLFIFTVIGFATICLFSINTVVEGRISSSTKHLDRHIDSKLKQEGIKPSKQSKDAEFLRRVYLDLTGKIPTSEEVQGFLKDRSKEKREKKINQLIGSERHLDYWSGIWVKWLVGRSNLDTDRRMELQMWVRNALKNNVPYNQFVKELLSVEGDVRQNGAGNFFVRYDVSPIDLTSQICRLFLGIPMQCAQCHDHKTEEWLQTDFYGVASFFTGTRREGVYEKDEQGRNRRVSYVIKDTEKGGISIPGEGEPIPPHFLDGKAYQGEALKRRQALGEWITRKDNPYFSHATVNRIWAYLMGRGFVEPLDGFGEEVPPTNPDLLDWLAEDFVIHGYDLQYLMRTILNSKAYQRTSETNKSNKNDESYYSHAYIKPLSAEQFFYSMLEATGFERSLEREKYMHEHGADWMENMKRRYLERFVFLLDNGEMEEIEAFNGTVPQALMMINGSLVNDSADHNERGSSLNHILKTTRYPAERVEQLYLRTLSRPPTTSEKTYFERYLKQSLYRNKELAYEDLYWALLNSAEFALNH